ncbi:putative ribonuclease H protein [Senna tora]|uniref:Putative ribonuclease H protein n=1 Tax=Senna tora TaxID=362788 RepID=A0A834XGP2_9FABA|nr:putative ribonuclease H protein [Senna tora]
METDSLLAVQLISKDRVDNHPLGPLLNMIKSVSSQMNKCSFNHVYREGNRVADRIANHGHHLTREEDAGKDHRRRTPWETPELDHRRRPSETTIGDALVSCRNDRDGMEAATSVHCTKLIVETDNCVVISLINDLNLPRSHSLFPLVHKCRSSAKELIEVDFRHIYREGNGVADCLAHHAMKENCDFTIFWKVPSFAYVVFCADATGTIHPRRAGVG